MKGLCALVAPLAWAAGFVACLSPLTKAQCLEAASGYTKVELTNLPVGGRPVAPNDAGEVAGAVSNSGALLNQAFVWKDGSVVTRSFVGIVTVADINEGGVVVGRVLPHGNLGNPYIFLWASRSGKYKSYPTTHVPAAVSDQLLIAGVDQDNLFGLAINPFTAGLSVIAFGAIPDVGVGTVGATDVQQGIVVGAENVFIKDLGFFMELPYRWTQLGGIQQLALIPGGFGGRASSINALGDIAGTVRDEFFTHTAALWTNNGNTLTNLGAPQGYFVSDALDLNVFNQVIVVAPNDLFGFTRGFLWEDGVYTDLSCSLPAGEFVSRPLSINKPGEILVDLTDAGGIFITETAILRPN